MSIARATGVPQGGVWAPQRSHQQGSRVRVEPVQPFTFQSPFGTPMPATYVEPLRPSPYRLWPMEEEVEVIRRVNRKAEDNRLAMYDTMRLGGGCWGAGGQGPCGRLGRSLSDGLRARSRATGMRSGRATQSVRRGTALRTRYQRSSHKGGCHPEARRRERHSRWRSISQCVLWE